MDWLDESNRGLRIDALPATPGAPAVVDFVAPGSGGACLVALSEWWFPSFFQTGRVLYYGAGFSPTGTGRWSSTTPDGATLSRIEDADDLHLWEKNNLQRRIARAVYLEQLAVVRTEYPDIDLDPWTNYVIDSPPFDLKGELRQSLARKRPVGRIYAVDHTSRPLAVLVVDDDGNAAVFGSNAYLTRMAGEWTSRGQRPGLTEYLAWLAEQQPTGLFSLDRPAVEEREGTVDEIALELMS
jgi:hypothetical protein